MSRDRRMQQRALLASETNLCPHGTGRGGQLSVCLVYPNRYQTGMSSLGFQTIYSLLASSPGVLCERAFLPDREELEEHRRSGAPLSSLESRRPLADFDIIAFSTSFEPDYLNIPLILKLGRIPLRAAERDRSHPLVMAGGAAFMINPEPVADFLDVVCIGEGEVIVPGLFEALMSPGSGRDELLHTLAKLPGIYIPAFHIPRYEGERLVAYETLPGAPDLIGRACADPELHPPSMSVILTENTEFG